MPTPVNPSSLKPGMRFDQSLFTRHGVKLLSPRVALTEEMVEALHEIKQSTLFLADSANEFGRAMPRVGTFPVRPGERASADYLSEGGMLVVEAGQEIEQHHIDAFHEGLLLADEEGEIRKNWANRLKLADAYAAQLAETFSAMPRKLKRGENPMELSPGTGLGWPEQSTLSRFREERVEIFRRMFARILGGLHIDAAGMFSLVDELIDKLRKYPERFTQIALLMPRKVDYLPDHSYTTAVLSIAIAARMGCSQKDVRLAGLSGLIADLGMGLIPRDIRTAKRRLNEIEINRVRRHPAFSVVLLDEISDLPDEVRMAALQHHERDNGSGYPNGLRSSRISDLAKIVAVADNFAAATEPRPYKPRKRPYDAIEELIVMGSQKLFDRRVVRALVEACGLFPVGSWVKLSTSETAVVIGAHAEQIDRPIVRVMPENPGDAPEVRDLLDFEPWELSVINAVEATPGLTGRLYQPV